MIKKASNFLSKRNPIILHVLFSIALYSILYIVDEIKQVPSSQNLINWDAGIYHNIKENGYSIGSSNNISNTGFYPLFPYAWKALNIDALPISIFNFILFATCLFYLSKEFKISNKIILLFISIPSMIFTALPYAESMFFLFTTTILLGLKKENHILISIGCILASLTRPSSLYFLPAAIVMISYILLRKNIDRRNINLFVNIVISTIIGTLICFSIYKLETGEFMAFFKMRVEGNSFSMPAFPLTTWRGSKLLWLDGLAFAICIASSLAVLKELYSFFSKKVTRAYDTIILFSIGYICIAAIHILFFNIKDATGHTSLLGLNRFVFATPIFLLLLNYSFEKSIDFKTAKSWTIVVSTLTLLSIGVFSIENMPEHLRPAIYILVVALFWTYKKTHENLWIGLYILQSILQVIVLGKFLQGLWIG